MKCQHHNKECDECEDRLVGCDDCKYIDAEGECSNEDSRRYCDFVDGIAVCCALYEAVK